MSQTSDWPADLIQTLARNQMIASSKLFVMSLFSVHQGTQKKEEEKKHVSL